MADTSGNGYVLTAYGVPYAMGYLKTRDGIANEKPLTTTDLLDVAVEMGMSGVEIPLYDRRGAAPLPIPQLKDELASRGLRIVPDYMTLTEQDADAEGFRQFLRDAASLGATVVRTLVSTVLCGDRRALAGGWEARMEAAAGRLREVLPLAEELGLAVAVENHQDATSGDLLRLYEMSGESPAYGICLDTGNPLAVGEGPVEFARRVAPLLRHLHLKDYTIHYAPEGYRLVRCPAGEGVVDYPAILAIARANGFPMLPGVEIAAQQTRTIPLLEDGWWECHTSDQPRHLPEALRVLWRHGRPAEEPYGSAWENGQTPDAILAEEWDVLRKSVAYFESLNPVG